MVVRTIARRSRNGLAVMSQAAERLALFGVAPAPLFAGVRLRAPDRTAAWGITKQIAGGEYCYPAMTPERGDRVIDIGANIGVFSLWAARRGAIVTAAYEPGPAAFAALQANVAGRSITPVHAAVVGNERQTSVDLYLHDARCTRNTILAKEIGAGDELTTRVSVPAIAIARVLEEPCDLLKIDCEGAEYELIDAIDENRLRHASRIVMEFHRIAGDPQRLLDRLRAADFEASILAGQSASESFGVIGATRR